MTSTPNLDRIERSIREQQRADGIVCTLCLYLGLSHDGDHLVP